MNNALNNLLSDKDSLLICCLLLMLRSEQSDKSLTLALLYILLA